MKKTPLDLAAEFAQDCVSRTPVIILGSGASVPHGIPGMGPLANAIRSADAPQGMTGDEAIQWEAFTEHLNTFDLETALNRVQFTDLQTQRVVEITRSFLLPFDVDAFGKLLHDRQMLPLARLYRHLVRSTHQTIEVVTSNYDRLAEYAADSAGLSQHTGFAYGYLNRRVHESTRIHHEGRVSRTVCIWKVHGSFDWFKHGDGSIFSLPACSSSPPGFVPVMVTPGSEKYRLVYDEPFRTILRCADGALEKARSYLCVGYGFNDQHLQTKLVERCTDQPVPITVITRTLSAQAKSFLCSGRCQRYLAFEAYDSGTRMYSHYQPDGVEISGHEFWKLDAFLELTIPPE